MIGWGVVVGMALAAMEEEEAAAVWEAGFEQQSVLFWEEVEVMGLVAAAEAEVD